MCTNYENDASPKSIADRFGLKDVPETIPVSSLRPTDPALVIGSGDNARILRWGFEAAWSKQPLVNARAETLSVKPTFRPSLENRCLVPASAYFEWRHDGRKRLKNRISLFDEGLMAFAGLISADHFTIITCPPVANIAHIHNRMPVILDRQFENDWLDPDASFDQVKKHLAPYTATRLQAIETPAPPEQQPDLFS